MAEWRINVDECDVVPEALPILEKYRKKRNEWQNWLSIEKYHAIDNQISSLIWNDAIYRLLYEMRRRTILSGRPKFACRNNHLSWMIDIGYTQFQLSTIRRLIEVENTRPEKQVISVKRLVDDVKSNSDIITREVFVGFDGTPYDYQSFEKFLDGLPESIKRARMPVARPQPDSWSEARHELFDVYSGESQDSRKRDDKMCATVFNTIESALGDAPFATLRTHYDKTVAHAADEISRAGAPLEGVPFRDIWECHKAIIGVRNEIASILSLPHMAVVPLSPSDVFDHLDAPFVMTSCIEHVIAEWQQENSRREAWANLPSVTTENDGSGE